MGMMKAYTVWDKYGDDTGATVVFAEGRGKAKSAALGCDCCEDSDYTQIAARRFPAMDEHYRGNTEMDWDDPKDRIALCKAGWHCHPDYMDDCATCPAQGYCEIYEE